MPETNRPAASPSSASVDLRLDNYLHEVVSYNDALQAQMFETSASRRKAKAEYGAFEPQLDLSATREANRRTNNVVQQTSQNGQLVFDERNNVYDAGVETLLPIGGKVRMGYTLNDLNNNANPYSSVLSTSNSFFTKQYQTFVGVNIMQPLLKNAGFATTMAPLRLAAMDSDIAFNNIAAN